MAGLKTYFINLAVAFDYLLNATFAGDPSETLTRRAARARREGRAWGCVLCALLDLIDKGHCKRFG